MAFYFSSCMMVHELISRQCSKQKELNAIVRKIDAFSKYATAIGKNGNMTMANLLKVPGMLAGRAMCYLAYAHNNAMMYVQQNAPGYIQMYTAQAGTTQTAEQQAMTQNYIYRQLYAQAREVAAQQEQDNLQEIEKNMEQEKEDIKNDLEQIKEELAYYRKQRDDSLKDLMPNSQQG